MWGSWGFQFRVRKHGLCDGTPGQPKTQKKCSVASCGLGVKGSVKVKGLGLWVWGQLKGSGLVEGEGKNAMATGRQKLLHLRHLGKYAK